MRLISTLGWTSKVVVDAAKMLNSDENIVIYGYVDDEEEKKVRAALQKVKNELSNITEVQVDPMNFHDCIVKIEKYLTPDSIANITGGTKIMAFSLALKAAILDLPIIYVTREKGKTIIKRMPIKLSSGKRNFFRIDDHDSTVMALIYLLITKYNGKAKLKNLRSDLNIKYSTISDAKNRLLRTNLITEIKSGREKILIANSAAYLFGGSVL